MHGQVGRASSMPHTAHREINNVPASRLIVVQTHSGIQIPRKPREHETWPERVLACCH